MLATGVVTASMLWNDGELLKARNLKRLYATLFTKPGLILKMAPEFLKYFRRDFAPWNHDNSALLRTWKQEYAQA